MYHPCMAEYQPLKKAGLLLHKDPYGNVIEFSGDI